MMKPYWVSKLNRELTITRQSYTDQAPFQSSLCEPGSCQNQKRGALWLSHLLPPCLYDNIFPDIGFKCNFTPRCTSLKSTWILGSRRFHLWRWKSWNFIRYWGDCWLHQRALVITVLPVCINLHLCGIMRGLPEQLLLLPLVQFFLLLAWATQDSELFSRSPGSLQVNIIFFKRQIHGVIIQYCYGIMTNLLHEELGG